MAQRLIPVNHIQMAVLQLHVNASEIGNALPRRHPRTARPFIFHVSLGLGQSVHLRRRRDKTYAAKSATGYEFRLSAWHAI